jgi:hypothetical protein
MKRICLFLLLCTIGSFATAQELQLENTTNGRTLTLKPGSSVALYLDMPTSDMITYSTRILEGELKAPEKGLLQVLPLKERKRYNFENGLYKHAETFYEDLIGRRPIRLELKDVNQLLYRTPSAEKLNTVGKLLLTAGMASALIAAPLASIDYGSGEFNGDRYFRIAGYSMAVSGIGLVAALGTRKRDFAILQPGESPGKKRWTLRILN